MEWKRTPQTNQAVALMRTELARRMRDRQPCQALDLLAWFEHTHREWYTRNKLRPSLLYAMALYAIDHPVLRKPLPER